MCKFCNTKISTRFKFFQHIRACKVAREINTTTSPVGTQNVNTRNTFTLLGEGASLDSDAHDTVVHKSDSQSLAAALTKRVTRASRRPSETFYCLDQRGGRTKVQANDRQQRKCASRNSKKLNVIEQIKTTFTEPAVLDSGGSPNTSRFQTPIRASRKRRRERKSPELAAKRLDARNSPTGANFDEDEQATTVQGAVGVALGTKCMFCNLIVSVDSCERIHWVSCVGLKAAGCPWRAFEKAQNEEQRKAENQRIVEMATKHGLNQRYRPFDTG